MSLRLRLTLWYSGVLALTMLLFGIVLYVFLNYFLYDQIRQDLKREAGNTSLRIQKSIALSQKGLVVELELENRDFYSTNTFLQLYNVNLKTFNRSANLQFYNVALPLDTSSIDKLKGDDGGFFQKTKVLEQDFLIYYQGIYDQSSNLIGILQAAVPIGSYERTAVTLKYTLMFWALFTIIVAASLGWFLSRKALQPIERVIDAANQIGSGDDLEKRIEYQGPLDEIGRLTQTINGMLSRIQITYLELDEAYRAQRRFVSDASHELRTPLTTIRGNVDLLEKMWKKTSGTELATPEQMQMSLEAMHDIAGEAQRMSRLVNDLLALARADAGVVMEKHPVEMLPLVQEVVRRAQLLEHTAEWQVGDLEVLDHAIVQGNRDYLQQLLFIFIENAFKYTPVGTVSIHVSRTNDFVGIQIADTGIGMDKEDIPRIFDRFYRADLSRGLTTGTGLGLSIAKWIIDEHGGSVEVTTRKDEGSTFMIWLPANFPLPV
ncbi:HAMP domain-containing sensor histidine kinase [Paenibacillus chondroitinus]|uniref:histidine kinase n=1 Tax=Paenibacillus chondroitinus TaxID=59842 RepID=A0ABU6D5G6_9BACL|nr:MULTISPECIES: HAMP domain-containing sensor histidine kinase [Paenibacillus]MCY9658007.1 HAMP domain-containing histidine kinase [Paenibacillus anseongense]MEB4792934.1 HAMP domain-containing sensor histidine kinase [Paenibacillus chondroitinus]